MNKVKNWINALHLGDQDALNYYFNCHYKALGYFAHKLIGDTGESENLVADCFLKLWEKRDTFQNDDHVKSFLYICCRNLCLNYLRDNQRKSIKQQVYLAQLEDSEETILNTIIEAEFLSILHEEVSVLPKKCKEVFNYIYFEQKKTDEIADILKTSTQTVRNHKTRAIGLLKEAMKKRGMSGLVLAFLFFID